MPNSSKRTSAKKPRKKIPKRRRFLRKEDVGCWLQGIRDAQKECSGASISFVVRIFDGTSVLQREYSSGLLERLHHKTAEVLSLCVEPTISETNSMLLGTLENLDRWAWCLSPSRCANERAEVILHHKEKIETLCIFDAVFSAATATITMDCVVAETYKAPRTPTGRRRMYPTGGNLLRFIERAVCNEQIEAIPCGPRGEEALHFWVDFNNFAAERRDPEFLFYVTNEPCWGLEQDTIVAFVDVEVPANLVRRLDRSELVKVLARKHSSSDVPAAAYLVDQLGPRGPYVIGALNPNFSSYSLPLPLVLKEPHSEASSVDLLLASIWDENPKHDLQHFTEYLETWLADREIVGVIESEILMVRHHLGVLAWRSAMCKAYLRRLKFLNEWGFAIEYPAEDGLFPLKAVEEAAMDE